MSSATQTGVRILHRVKGRPAIERSIRSLLIRVHRYARARATTSADMLWAARTIAGLEALLTSEETSTNIAVTEFAKHHTSLQRGSGLGQAGKTSTAPAPGGSNL